MDPITGGYPQQPPGGYQRHKKLIIFSVCLIVVLIVFIFLWMSLNSKDGQFSNWSTWSTCDKTCGDGTQFRTRTYIPPVHFGSDLQDKDKLKEIKKCNQGPCTPSPNASGSGSGGSNASGSSSGGSSSGGSGSGGSGSGGSSSGGSGTPSPTPSVSVPRNWAGYEYTPNNECGPFKNNKACPSGQCCSILGFCGSTDAHCKQMGTSAAGGYGSIHNGLYNDTRPSYNSANLNNMNWAGFEYSTDNRCGPYRSDNKACPNGQCCSNYGYCGSTDDFCRQIGTGGTNNSGSLSRGLYNSIKPSYYGTNPVVTNWAGFEYSTDDRCGIGYNSKACPNNKCCSFNGRWCGSTTDYCDQTAVLDSGLFNNTKPSNWVQLT